ncbi:MAG: PTS system mannose/fructose/sorbose family transporter subunit IID [Candidatus Limivicinus sp.]|nr:PTS system mannose/fructose/sorbose family transporter subunit IID [Clostridiales bacterium]MDY4225070.1 PTS system mannose/fructose/sorbose family transporter subunit IID [Candidatus Limivicinus sp.]MDY5084054.1 PTS system mannose/fructose/sorbose family transporter subunit IID [Candidatus Limivicinus sp.]
MKTVSKKTLKKSFLNWFFWNGCSQQAETMLGMAFGQSMAPVIDELYETKEDKAAALQRHITLFNTESQVGSICNGIAIGMEEQLANGNGSAESIQEAKVALIGPTSAIGDSLWVATIIPLLLTICLSIASAIPGSAWVGALLYMIIYPLGTYLLSWKLFNLGYKAGLDGVQRFMASGELDRIMQAITVLGLIVVGALTASFVTCNLNIDIKTAAQVFDSASGTYVEGVISVFNLDNLLNNVFPHIVPLALTLGVYNLYTKKNWTPLAIMGMILVLAAVLTAIGYIPAVGAFA